MQPDVAMLERALRASQGGDVGAFNGLVQTYQRQVYNLCYRTLGNAEDAADATQDAFLSAFRSLATFQGAAAGFRGWLLRIAINACYDQLRRRQRRPSESLDALGSGGPDESRASDRIADPAAGPELQALNSETARQIQAAIDRLPPDQRLTVILSDVQGLSYEEVAHAMDVELGTVKSRLSRARARLRELLILEKNSEPGNRAQRLEQRNP